MTRQRARSVALFVVLAALLSAATLAERGAERYFTSGIAYGTAALQPVSDVPANRYGVNAFLEDDVYAWQVQRDFAAIKAGGFGWVRQEFLWDQIEPDAKGNHVDHKNGVDAWAKWDRIVALAQQNDVKLIARLDFAPAWASAGNPDSGRCPTLCPPPNNPRDFADFAGAVAGRYAGKIAAYQVWNEPNLQHDWAGVPISPAAYTALLRAAFAAIKAADPSAIVVSAALAPNRGDSAQNMSDLAFLRGMYAAGAARSFDVLGAQAYGLDHPAYDRQLGLRSTDFPRALLPQSEPFTFDRPVLLHQIMQANGDGAKAVWVTEFGWMTLPAGWTGNPSPWSAVPAAERLRSTVEAWQRAAIEWPWMGPLNLWYLRDPVPADPRDPTPYFAILRPDWLPTPLYDAVRAQATAPASAASGLYGPVDPAADYGPHGFKEAWHAEQINGRPVQAAGAPGANMAFLFSGNTLWLSVARGPNGGMARITIDQVPGLASGLPEDASGNRILDTYAPTPQSPVQVSIASGLPDEPHQFDLEVLPARHAGAAGSDVAIAGFGVTIDRPAIWSYLKAGLGLGWLLLLLWPGMEVVRWGWERQGLSALLTNDRLVFVVWCLALAAFYVSPRLPLTIAFALALGVLGLLRPDLGVLLVPAVVSLEFLPKRVGGAQVSLLEVLIAVCAAGWLLRCYWRRRLLIVRGPFAPLAVGLLLVGFLSLFASAFPRFSLRDYREVILEPVLYFVVVTALLAPSRVRYVVDVAIAGGAAVGLLSLAAFALHRGVIATEGVTRLAGLYPSPDNLALYLERPLALAGGVALWSSGRRRGLCVLACLPMALAVLLTFTRGAWLAVVLTAALAGLLVNRRLLLLAAAAAASVVAAALLSQARRFTSLFQFGVGSTSGRRLLLWRSAWDMVRTHPLQGIGLDNFLYQYPRYRLPGADSEPFLSHPHNLILDFWLSLGLWGLIWLGWTAATIARAAHRGLTAKDGQARALALGLMASLVVAALHGMVDNSYFLPDLAVLFWMALAGLHLLTPPGEGREAER